MVDSKVKKGRKSSTTKSGTKVKKRKKATTRGKSKGRGKKRSLKMRLFYLCLNLSIFFAVIILSFFVLVYAGAFGHIPSSSELKLVKNPIASEVYSQDNVLLGRYYFENRSNVKFNEIAPHVINALIATEDARFYEHKGIDEMALARVFIKTIVLRQRNSGGGSTLSQQTAKNIFGRGDFGKISMPVNKFRESVIAYRLESIFTKEEILTLYLNTVPFGESVFGIETAAERYFSKPAKSLNLTESATLVGMLKSNSAYNPRLHPERSKQRRNVVMNQMVKEDFITSEQYAKYSKYPLGVRYNKLVRTTGSAQYIREKVRLKVAEWCKSHTKSDGENYNLYTDGLKIYTTIDSKMQKIAERSVANHTNAVQKQFDQHWAKSKPWDSSPKILERAVTTSDRYKLLKSRGKSRAEIDKILSARGESGVSTLDSIKRDLMVMHPGFIAMDPHSGDVKVWVGGRDFSKYQYDQVMAKRQVGSVFKPIVYAAALERGVRPDEYIANRQERYPDFQNWSPKNSDGDYNGFYSMQGAVTKSINTIAVKVLMKAGIDNVIDLAHDMGIESDLPEVPSLALGVADVSLLEVAECYSVFASGGKQHDPRVITRIEDESGKVLERFDSSKGDQLISKNNAAIINKYTSSVVDNGTGRGLRTKYGITGDIGGKTGTTQNGADGWFVGYTSELVVVARMGAINPTVHFRTIKYGQGAYLGLPHVGQFYKDLYADSSFDRYRRAHFVNPDRETMAMLQIPLFKSELKSEKRGLNLGDIFNSDKREESDIVETKKSDPEESKDSDKSKKRRRGLWKRIKGAFSGDK